MQGVIFDMDGVLVDSYRAHFEAWRRLGRRHGYEMTEAQFATTFGRTSRDIIENLWPGAATADEALEWDRWKEAAYREIIAADFPEMPGASELIAALAGAGFTMAIGSSGPPENVAAVLARLGGAHLIAAAVNGSEVTRGKPDPEVFLKAAGKLGLAPSCCAVVEDAPAGLEAARRAGMKAIAITGTAPREQLAQRADVVVERLSELTPERIATLIGAGD
ncbi:MAG: HAD family phosphatase [Planctomycetota bacterium]|nr:HAD family phosphatase [Planctomycetota bacterium]